MIALSSEQNMLVSKSTAPHKEIAKMTESITVTISETYFISRNNRIN